MRRGLCIFFLILLISVALLGVRSASLASLPSKILIGIDASHSNLHSSQTELQNLTSLLTSNGAQVEYSNTPLNQTFLSSLSAFVITSPTINYTSNELTILANWYQNGGNLWLSASSENITAITSLNLILQSIQSSLAFENGYAADPIFNINLTSTDSADLLAPIINHNLATGALTNNIRILYAHTPIPILGYMAGKYTRFNSSTQTADTLIAATSSTTEIANISTTKPLQVYSTSTPASVPIVAVEQTGKSRLALTGFPIFSDWKEHMNYLQQKPYDNRLLVANLLRWLTPITINSEIEATSPFVKTTGQLLTSIDNASSNLYLSASQIKPFETLLTSLGISSKTFISFAPALVGDPQVEIIQAAHRPPNPDERAQIINWFNEGNKTLILTSAADYSLDGNATESEALNLILLDLHSNLRVEQAALYDPQVNVGGMPYLALSSIINHQSSSAANITKNVRSLFLHFGTILDGWNQTAPIPLESNLSLPVFQNITWISRTSNSSYLAHLSTTYPMLAHKSGDTGSFITSAIETLKTNRIILLGGPMFTNFNQLLAYPTIYNYPVDNLLLIRNIFTQLLHQTLITTEINGTAKPTQLSQRGTVTFSATYSARLASVSDLSIILKPPVTPANLTLTFNGATVNLTRLSNGTYTSTVTANSPGTLSWSIAASAKNYQSQSLSNSIEVTATPRSFTWYVLSIPIAIFIAVTIAVTVRKTR